MLFRTKILGYSKRDVDHYLIEVERMSAQKNAQIEAMEREIYSLQCEKDELEVRARILGELLNSRNNDERPCAMESNAGYLPERRENG